MISRQEQLEFCKRCTKRQLDMKEGLLCSLTGQKAAFEKYCPDFEADPEVVITPSDQHESVLPEKKTYEAMLREQDFARAVLFGAIASIVAAVLWAVITIVTNMMIGYVAVAIGAVVGFTIRWAGKGVESKFAILGAIYSLVGCFIGNLLCVAGFLSAGSGMSVLDIIDMIDVTFLFDMYQDSLEPMDFFFYAIAVYEGFRFSTLPADKIPRESESVIKNTRSRIRNSGWRAKRR
ncbi:MAG: hypothetical protein KDD36_02515 [Flavobacteriales bacterium]|nr:hypothetical protein [Flavobacteriales bacterium]